MGQYRLYHTDPLTTDEFASQPVAVQKTWGKDILVKSWGHLTSARVFFRKVHGRVPSGEQVSTLANDKKRLEEARSHLTWQDVTAAFKRGEEEIVVYAMKCIDYDIEFQRILARNYRYFTPPEPKRKMPAASAHQPNTKVSAERKRQRSVSLTPEPSEDDSGDDANGDGYGGA